jgi:hypothetical protein
VGDWRLLHRLYGNRSGYQSMSGNQQAARADSRRALAVAERIDRAADIAYSAMQLTWLSLQAGEWVEARALAKAIGLEAVQHRATNATATLALLEGNVERATLLVQQHVEDARRRGDVQTLTSGLYGLADMALQAGRLAEAEALARDAHATQLTWLRRPNIDVTLAEVLVRGRTQDAAEVVAKAEAGMAASSQESLRPQLLRTRGLLLRQQGDLTGALSALQASAESARAQGVVLQLGRTLADLADTARSAENLPLAAAADAERAAIIERIGPEIRRLGWLWAGGGV